MRHYEHDHRHPGSDCPGCTPVSHELDDERALADSLAEALGALEWSGDPDMGYPICPECGGWRPDAMAQPYQGSRSEGHDSDCNLARALALHSAARGGAR